MRGTLAAVIAIAALLLVSSAPASAITYGEPDNGEHPYVGLVVFYLGVDEAGNPIPAGRCSGTLLSPYTFLTAGHCTAGTELARVYMEENVSANSDYPSAGGILGTPITHPLYDDFATFPDTSDLGLVILNEPYEVGVYGVLPDLGSLDGLATRRGQQDITFESVGYGLQGVKPDLMSERDRFKVVGKLNDLRGTWPNIQLSNAPGVGGGACFGDSGGPIFHPVDSNVLAGVISFGSNKNCKGNDFAYRLDIGNAQDFIWSNFV